MYVHHSVPEILSIRNPERGYSGHHCEQHKHLKGNILEQKMVIRLGSKVETAFEDSKINTKNVLNTTL